MRLPLTQNCPKYCMGKVSRIPTIGDYTIFFNSLFFVLYSGQGFVIGHQWTNIVLIINEILIPLPPIPFYSKQYCQDHNRSYWTEHELVVDYLANLNLEDYIGSHNPREVLVLTDSGYDNKKIQNIIIDKNWTFVMALKKKTKRQV